MTGRRARALATGALVLAVTGWLTGPAGVLAGDLPACRYDDLPTKYQGYGDWSRTLVDPIYEVGSDYEPPDLVAISDAGLDSSLRVRAVLVEDLRALVAAAEAAGARIAVQSAYRSFARQVEVYSAWVAQFGEQDARLSSARPGHSEHQLGLAIDVRSDGGPEPWDEIDWATTRAGAWMAAHGWEYGFVMSYPKAQSPDVTCYRYEPWHYRYVGRFTATQIHASGLTIREYLWLVGNSTLTDPSATATPTASPSPTRAPTPSRSPTSSPAPTPAPSPTGMAPQVVALVGMAALAGLGGVLVWLTRRRPPRS